VGLGVDVRHGRVRRVRRGEFNHRFARRQVSLGLLRLDGSWRRTRKCMGHPY
jgi:hypothetical protein